MSDEDRPGLLVVAPDVGLDTIGGERIRKLTAAFDAEGWRLIGIAPPARDYLSSDAPWPESLVVHRTFDVNPWSFGVLLKRRLARDAARPTATPHAAAESEDTSPSRMDAAAIAALKRLWPYPWAGWVPFAVARGVAVTRHERPAVLFSSFSPTASHMAALGLHRLTGLPWIADFRDPWTWGARHGYIWARERFFNVRAEATVMRRATVLTTIGKSLGDELAARAGRSVVVLPHGIPLERVARSPAERFERLEIVHAGTVDSWSADIAPLTRALMRLKEEGIPARLTLIGPIVHRSRELERALELDLVTILGTTSRQEAQQITASADVALIVQKRPSKIWVTTKLWDYLASHTPILVAASADSDAAEIVRETRSGWITPFDDEAEIARVLKDAYERRRRGETLWDPDAEALSRYDAASISRRFVDLLNELRQ